MNDRGILRPDEHLDATWNGDVNKTDAMQRFLYNTNQFFVNDGIQFHDHVQKDMGLNAGETWYPTEEMANGEVPFYPPCKTVADPEPDPAKVESMVEYTAPEPVAKPGSTSVPATKSAPVPKSMPEPGAGTIDYKMLQRSIKTQ
ncbi:hypothetical protein [Cerasicoccus arenae]|nr:hypothetical protein [Cerasicoccus arenae]MBK1859379.1 hypothetical protein [Cerasicoccus arenae]